MSDGITIDMYANALVTDALKTIRIATPNNAPTGENELTGMRLLNEILTKLNTCGATLPYFYTVPFTLVMGQSKYYFGQGELADIAVNFPVDIAFINLYSYGTKYPVEIINDQMALSSLLQYSNNLIFMPSQARVYKEQDPLGITYTIIDFLYPPDNTYEADFRGKPSLSQAGVNDYLAMLPLQFHTYLRLQLAYMMVPYYGRDDSWSDILEAQRLDAERTVMSGNTQDLDVISSNPLRPFFGFYSSRLGIIR